MVFANKRLYYNLVMQAAYWQIRIIAHTPSWL